MNSKVFILFAIGLSVACSVSGKFVSHHRHEEKEEVEETTKHHVDEEDEEHHGHAHHGHHGHHGHHHRRHDKFQCQGKDMTFSNEAKTAHKTCWKALKARQPTETPSTGEHHHKHGRNYHKSPRPDACFAACKFEKLNLLEDGQLDMDAVEKHVEGSFPKSAREEITTRIADCNSKLNETLSTDDKCKSFIPLTKCIWSSIVKVCKEKKTEHHHHHKL